MKNAVGMVGATFMFALSLIATARAETFACPKPSEKSPAVDAAVTKAITSSRIDTGTV